jgi:hypothetical protein
MIYIIIVALIGIMIYLAINHADTKPKTESDEFLDGLYDILVSQKATKDCIAKRQKWNNNWGFIEYTVYLSGNKIHVTEIVKNMIIYTIYINGCEANYKRAKDIWESIDAHYNCPVINYPKKGQ